MIALLAAGLALLQTHAASVPPEQAVPEWARLARKLTGESDAVRAEALKALAARPSLDAELRAAIETPGIFDGGPTVPAETAPGSVTAAKPSTLAALALDVTLALKRQGLLPALWQYESRDLTGATLLTALTLDTTDEPPGALRGSELVPAAEGSASLRERLFGIAMDRDAALARRLVALDALGRLGWRWLPRHARALYKDRAEVQLAWLGALRARVFREGDAEDLALLEPAFESPIRAIRMRAASIAGELTRAGTRRLREALQHCADPECQKLLRGL